MISSAKLLLKKTFIFSLFRLFAAAVFVAAAAAEQYVPHNKIAAIAAVSFAAAAAVVFSAAAKQQKYDKNIVTSAHRLFSSPLILSFFRRAVSIGLIEAAACVLSFVVLLYRTAVRKYRIDISTS